MKKSSRANQKYRIKLLLEKYLRRKNRIALNKRKKILVKTKKITNPNIIIPNDISFATNWESFVEILNDIQYTIGHRFIKNRSPLSIDHSLMSKVTPSSILVLASTIEKSQKLAGIKLKGNKSYLPQNETVRYLLNEIDYWKYFNVSKLKTNFMQNRFTFFKILDSYQVDNTKIGKMIEFFEKQVGFNNDAKSLLNTALCEASANTVEHGYNNSNINKDTDRWWLTASIDKQEGTISFVFYDQGMGIFKSLEHHKNSQVKKLYNRASNLIKDKPHAKILQHMLSNNASKHNTINRGYGMQTFKNFIDKADNGLLFIASENASYEYPKDSLKEYSNSLSGTLIVWKIQVNHDINSNIYLKGDENDLL